MTYLPLALLTLLTALTAFSAPAPTTTPDRTPARVQFNRDIRPILSQNCYACHGPDPAKRKADLRLDQETGAKAALESGETAVIPFKPDQSRLLTLIHAQDPDDRMPPPKTGKSITPHQQSLLRTWIAEGAVWESHWAYLPPENTTPAPLQKPAQTAHPIDQFVQARLQTANLRPAPEADRITLLRRLHFDVVGLPPSPAEVAAFESSRDPRAYEQALDRLLESPHFGERLAILWLDLVRYGDSEGYHGDQHREIHLYRDYVIRSFNENKPFDRFTIEQIAGDLLPEASLDHKIASGYNRILMTTQEGGAQPKEYIAKYAADRVRNTSAVWLGSTMGCAECHDHKYDPFTTRDFYSLAAFFADVKEKALGPQEPFLIPDDTQKKELDELEARKATFQTQLDTQTPELDAALQTWQQLATDWHILRPALMTAKQGATLQLLEDGSILAAGPHSSNETYTLTVPIQLEGVTAFRIELLPDPSLPKNGPGRSPDGNALVTEFELAVAGQNVEWSTATASFAEEKKPASNLIDRKRDTAWSFLGQTGEPHEVILETKTNVGGPATTLLTFNLHQDPNDTNTLGRFRLSATTERRPVTPAGTRETRRTLETPAADRCETERENLARVFRSHTSLLDDARASRDDASKKIDALKTRIPKTFVTERTDPRPMRVLPRGNWLDESGPTVEPAIPAFLGALPARDSRPTRLDLAQWLVGPSNPLVARVFVNRVWRLFFGQGLVRSMEDFGSQGALPSHPELLDWLALDFQNNGWNVKRLVKTIATSATYRQSSRDNPALRELDPYNTLLARQTRFRLDAELVRDNALAVSGLLNRATGGSSVKPYQPAGYWALLNFPKREYQADPDDNQYRRGLYTYWARTFPHPSLLAFDAPSREECTSERVRSNTPQQALVLLNDPIYVEAARAFAERILLQGGRTHSSRIQFAFSEALARRATSDEIRLLRSIQQQHLIQYRDDPTAANALLKVGNRPTPRNLDPAELASWTSVARVLLNLHETITRS